MQFVGLLKENQGVEVEVCVLRVTEFWKVGQAAAAAGSQEDVHSMMDNVWLDLAVGMT